jgi:hypothetical protein
MVLNMKYSSVGSLLEKNPTEAQGEQRATGGDARVYRYVKEQKLRERSKPARRKNPPAWPHGDFDGRLAENLRHGMRENRACDIPAIKLNGRAVNPGAS